MYFTDAHEELRLHIRKFLTAEVQPHLEEWEETTFPDSIFNRFGELGFLGLRYPPEYGGQGGDYFSAVVLSEEMARAWRWTSRPRWRHRRCSSSGPRSRSGSGWFLPSEASTSRRWRSRSPTPAPTWPGLPRWHAAMATTSLSTAARSSSPAARAAIGRSWSRRPTASAATRATTCWSSRRARPASRSPAHSRSWGCTPQTR